jgi:hypothetical protein
MPASHIARVHIQVLVMFCFRNAHTQTDLPPARSARNHRRREGAIRWRATLACRARRTVRRSTDAAFRTARALGVGTCRLRRVCILDWQSPRQPQPLVGRRSAVPGHGIGVGIGGQTPTASIPCPPTQTAAGRLGALSEGCRGSSAERMSRRARRRRRVSHRPARPTHGQGTRCRFDGFRRGRSRPGCLRR